MKCQQANGRQLFWGWLALISTVYAYSCSGTT